MKYSLSSRILHWIIAVLIIFMIGLGIYMTEFLSKESSNRLEIYSLHKSIGVLLIILVFMRFINRFINKPPKLPESISKLDRTLAGFGHIALYAFMIIVPISGYLMSNSYGYPVHFFSIEMPFLVGKNFENAALFSKIHYYAGYTILALVIIHILAVIKHRFFDKAENDVLKRMI